MRYVSIALGLLLAARSLPVLAAGAADTDPEWVGEAQLTEELIRKAVADGTAVGRKEPVYIRFAGRSQRGQAVSATDAQIVVSLRGVEAALPWEGLGPKEMYSLRTRYLPPASPETHLRPCRYCLVHGFMDEARRELDEALRLDPGKRSDKAGVLAVREYLKAKGTQRVARELESATRAAAPKRPRRAAPVLPNTRLIRAASLRAARRYSRIGSRSPPQRGSIVAPLLDR